MLLFAPVEAHYEKLPLVLHKKVLGRVIALLVFAFTCLGSWLPSDSRWMLLISGTVFLNKIFYGFGCRFHLYLTF